VLLEVLLGGSDELDGSKLEAAVLKARDDGADQAALCCVSTTNSLFLQLPQLLFNGLEAIDER
jgi:hypothetical protein